MAARAARESGFEVEAAGLKPGAPADLFPNLTEREREILGLVAQGYNNSEIAQRLVLSGKTERNYISNIFSKLQVADRAQASVRAREPLNSTFKPTAPRVETLRHG